MLKKIILGIVVAVILIGAENLIAREKSGRAQLFRRGRNQSNFRRNTKHESRQSRAARPKALDAGKRTKDSFEGKKHARDSRDGRKHARGSPDTKKHDRGSFDTTKLIQQSPRRDHIERIVRDRPRRGREHIHARHRPGRAYRRRLHRIFHRVVRPKYRQIIYYSCGPRFKFRYVHPYYHRKYVFVSLGGFWPVEYRYVRYYWYGCHPYYWYGRFPAAYEVQADTYNYYTYNYYNNDNATALESSQATGSIRPVDHNTFADVREKLARQSAEQPNKETLADNYFEDAVKAFEEGDYGTAVDKFDEAIKLEPDDTVLPFAYVQALFADEEYSKAAEVLREAIRKLPPDQEGVFFPRGLYHDDDILFEQIDRLAEKADLYRLDGDLQLLLGYQLLGAEKLDQAIQPLQRAALEPANKDTAALLLDLLKKIKTDNSAVEDTGQ